MPAERVLHRQQRVADGGEAALDQLAVGVGQAAQVGDQHEQRLVVLGEQVVPRRRRGVGDLAQRRVGAQARVDGDRLGGGGPLDLEGAQLVEDHLDLVGDARQPPGLAGEDQVLLLLGLEQQQVQELLLPPQQCRQVLVVHVSTALPSCPSASRRAASRRRPGGCFVDLPSAPRRGASSRSDKSTAQVDKEMCRRAVPSGPGSAEK